MPEVYDTRGSLVCVASQNCSALIVLWGATEVKERANDAEDNGPSHHWTPSSFAKLLEAGPSQSEELALLLRHH